MANPGIIEQARQMLSAAGHRSKKRKARTGLIIETSNVKATSTTARANSRPTWMETEARVTACRYEFARMNTFTLGIAANTDKFTISFTYYAHGRTYSDNFISPVARAQGETFSVSYNALNPRQNTKSASNSTNTSELFAIGIVVYILLSILFFTMVRG